MRKRTLQPLLAGHLAALLRLSARIDLGGQRQKAKGRVVEEERGQASFFFVRFVKAEECAAPGFYTANQVTNSGLPLPGLPTQSQEHGTTSRRHPGTEKECAGRHQQQPEMLSASSCVGEVSDRELGCSGEHACRHVDMGLWRT